MNESELNNYLEALEGFADIEFISREKHDVSGQITIRFSGDTGSIDKGEIELTFYGVEIMYLPFRFIPNFKFSQQDAAISNLINPSDIEADCHLYTIKDDVNTWWVYAKSYDIHLLPVFYGESIKY